MAEQKLTGLTQVELRGLLHQTEEQLDSLTQSPKHRELYQKLRVKKHHIKNVLHGHSPLRDEIEGIK